MKADQNSISRRKFLTQASLAAAAFTIVPRHVLGGKGYKAPSDTLNIACIGVGGKGYSDLHAVASENIVALCDVDEERAAKAFEEFPKPKKYYDFRRMLDKEHKHIDAVTISTPDHTHAVAAMAAIQLDKHVFVQKPLTHSVYEARMLAKAAKEKGVVTQMGNQGHAGEGARLICEWIWAGAIGEVYEVHTWTNRPIWPQGKNVTRPQEIPTTPPTLHWNIWLGPAPWRPYHPAYVPFNWRGWWDFGTGALGDMGAHIMDMPYWALKLDLPESIQATSTGFNEETYPAASIVRYQFPKRGDMPPVKLVWYDGGLMPPRPEDLEEGRRMGNQGGGCIFYGTKGKIMCSVYGENPRLIPESKMREFEMPPKTIPRSPGIHQEWIEAIKKGTKSTTDFEYSARLTETMLLGNVAIKAANENKILRYDGKNMRFINSDQATALLTPEFRKGWSLEDM